MVMGMRRGPKQVDLLGGNFNLPLRPFSARIAILRSLARYDLRKSRNREQPQRAVIANYCQLLFVLICPVRRIIFKHGSPSDMGD